MEINVEVPEWRQMLGAMFESEIEARALENVVEAVVVSDPGSAPPGVDPAEWEQMENEERVGSIRRNAAKEQAVREEIEQEARERFGYSEQAGPATHANSDSTPPTAFGLGKRRRNARTSR
jgi:hypothetical protein